MHSAKGPHCAKSDTLYVSPANIHGYKNYYEACGFSMSTLVGILTKDCYIIFSKD